ncbi:hypothetical protein [Corynebacterium sp. 335C]
MNGFNDGRPGGRGFGGPGSGPQGGGDGRGFGGPGFGPQGGGDGRGFGGPGFGGPGGAPAGPGRAPSDPGGARRTAAPAPGEPYGHGAAARVAERPRPEPNPRWFRKPEGRRSVERPDAPGAGDGGAAWSLWTAIAAQVGVIAVILFHLVGDWGKPVRTAESLRSGAELRPDNLEILTILWGVAIVAAIAGIVGCILRKSWGRYLLTVLGFLGLLLLLPQDYVIAGVLSLATIILLWLPPTARWFSAGR